MDILKPVDPEELKLIESEPYEQRDLSVRAMAQFLALIFFTIVGSVIISYSFLLGLLACQNRKCLPFVKNLGSGSSRQNRACRGSRCAIGRTSCARRLAKPPPTAGRMP